MEEIRKQIIAEILETLELYLEAQRFDNEDAWLYRESLNVHMKKYKELPIERLY